jgi:hypothetical protein
MKRTVRYFEVVKNGACLMHDRWGRRPMRYAGTATDARDSSGAHYYEPWVTQSEHAAKCKAREYHGDVNSWTEDQEFLPINPFTEAAQQQYPTHGTPGAVKPGTTSPQPETPTMATDTATMTTLANSIARAAGYGSATRIIIDRRMRKGTGKVVARTRYGYRKCTTDEYVSNAYLRAFRPHFSNTRETRRSGRRRGLGQSWSGQRQRGGADSTRCFRRRRTGAVIGGDCAKRSRRRTSSETSQEDGAAQHRSYAHRTRCDTSRSPTTTATASNASRRATGPRAKPHEATP